MKIHLIRRLMAPPSPRGEGIKTGLPLEGKLTDEVETKEE